MKRRYFLGGLGLSILSFKNWFPKISSPAETLQPIRVAPGATFELPARPRANQKFSFIGSDAWASSPATIKRNGCLIMGYDQDLTLDTNNDFSLAYDENLKSWVLG